MIQRKRLSDLAATSAVEDADLLMADENSLFDQPSSRSAMERDPENTFQGAAISASTSQQLTMFNLVFAMKKTGDGSHRVVDATYEYVLAKITAGLKYEQLKRGFIRKEAEMILAIRDDFLSSGKESSLARLLAHTFHSVRRRFSSHVVLNSSIDLALQIPAAQFQERLTRVDSSKFADVDDKFAIDLRPNNALLLLFDPEEVIKMILPLDASPLLSELIEIVTPTQSVKEFESVSFEESGGRI
ncbi:Nitrogen permease regulator 3 [Dinochytrium kinnereticum]|nr:Nitrogen permease regulator 3 [Dinochytrium kinnereticum]